MAKPKIALVPAAQGSKFYSVLPSSGVGDFTFSRSGSATRINSQGLIETVGNGASRLNYPMIDGKVVGCPSHILEPQRTNLIPYSEDFSQSDWSKFRLSVSTDSIISPDGNSNTYEITEDSTNNSHVLRFAFTSLNTDYSFSFFVKSKSRDRYIELDLGHTTNKSIFDIENGIIISDTTNNAKITSLDNDWYKISISDTVLLNENSYDIRLVDKSTGSDTYLGNGTSGVYIYGAQLEQGSYPTSYIPTNGSTVTRSAETANGSGDADTFNDSEGVLLVECSTIAYSGGVNESYCISINDGTTSNRIELLWFSDGKLYTQVGNSGQEHISSDAFNNKILIKYGSGSYNLYVNGFRRITDTFTSISGLDTLDFRRHGSYTFKGKTKQIQYYDSALTDSELETLTSWVSFSDMANGQLYTIQ